MNDEFPTRQFSLDELTMIIASNADRVSMHVKSAGLAANWAWVDEAITVMINDARRIRVAVEMAREMQTIDKAA